MDIRIYVVPLCVMSLLALVFFGIDKSRAADGRKRIPELVLLTMAALGGSVGAVLGSILFHHKVNVGRKLHFFITLYGSLALHLALLIKLLLALL
ncbi:MAG: DUF1294 domain-containing protein [Clostridia bacterium]|nr:DUF1294 domain-containing protein [Clostridia bacterium]